jgi:Na+-translocating ferredoxin:NAD+ oxidoreductase RnfA subunit
MISGTYARASMIDGRTHSAGDFSLRITVLLGLMSLVAAAEFVLDRETGASSAAAWGYGIAIYAVCLMMHQRGAAAECRTSQAIGLILVLAALHGLYDLISEVASPTGYKLVGVHASTWVSLPVSLAGAALLMRFRNDLNPVIKAAWTIALVDIVLAAEAIGFSAALDHLGSTGLAIGSDVFDIGLTLAAAASIMRHAPAPVA